MVTLIGTYEGKADAKGRLLLSSPLKKQLAAVLQDGFVLKRSVFQPCLELIPMLEWAKIMEKMSGLNKFNKKNADFIRLFSAGVKMIEMDASGRILIPKDLQAIAGISKNVVLAAQFDKIEIWDKEKYESTIASAADDFAAMAEEGMGNKNEDGVS